MEDKEGDELLRALTEGVGVLESSDPDAAAEHVLVDAHLVLHLGVRSGTRVYCFVA